MFEEVFSRAEFDEVDELFTDDFLAHAFPHLRGPEGVKTIVSGFHGRFPIIEWSVEKLVGEGAFVTVRWTAKGTQEGEFRGHSATGNPVEFPRISMFRFENDQIAEGWTLFEPSACSNRLTRVMPRRIL